MDWVEHYERRAAADQRRADKATGPITKASMTKDALVSAKLSATINRWIEMGEMDPSERPGGAAKDPFNYPKKTTSQRRVVNQKGHG